MLTGIRDPAAVKVQFSRWSKAGKLIKLKNNFYLLAEEFRKVEIYEPHIASVLKQPSYISLEKAFEYYNLIPEAVLVYTCISTKRPGKIITPIGSFDYRHIKMGLFWGYEAVTVNKQQAFIAKPEKALLDFFYLRNWRIEESYLEEMRLQNFKNINMGRLIEYAKRFESLAALNAAQIIRKYVSEHKRDWELL